MKIRKFLASFLGRGVEPVKAHPYLEFISAKHKVPIEVVARTPKLQSGYVSSQTLRERRTFTG